MDPYKLTGIEKMKFNILYLLMFSLSLLFREQVCGEILVDCIPFEDCCLEMDCSTECCEAWEAPFRWYVDHAEGRWLDNHDGYTSLGVFCALPNTLITSNLFPFLDARMHLFNHGGTAGNFGGGLRYLDRDNNRVIGFNAFYDYRKSSWNNYFHQVGAGVEILNDCWDFRFNGYFPVSGWKHSKKKRFDHFVGSFTATCQERRAGARGWDMELGRWLMKKGPCRCFDLYGAIGSYYYSFKEHRCNAIGGDVRLATNIGQYFNFEVKGGYDKVYHGNVQAKITLTFPLGVGMCCDVNNCIVYQPVRRQEIIALGKKECCWKWDWSAPSCMNCGR